MKTPSASPGPPAAHPSSAALYTQLGPTRYRAAELTAGPWTGGAQHGSPVAALLLHCIQQLNDAAPLPLARITVELVRPVPITTLEVTARVRRPGRHVELTEAAMHHGDELVALARAWKLAGDATTVAGSTHPMPRPPQPTGRGVIIPQLPEAGFHRHGIEADFVVGGFLEPGPATAWLRLTTSVVAGFPVSPEQRALVAADFGNGFSSTVDPSEVTFVNPDLTLYLSGTPRSEWIAISATTFAGSQGYGFAESVLFDEHGPFGRGVQSLLFRRRR